VSIPQGVRKREGAMKGRELNEKKWRGWAKGLIKYTVKNNNLF
jgi:hypothetical protein